MTVALSLRTIAGLAAIGLGLAGCSGSAGESLPVRKQPAFFRLFNASERPAEIALDGRAFGNSFAPGASSAMTRMPPKPIAVGVTRPDKSGFRIDVPLGASIGTTLYLLENSGVVLDGDRYAPQAGGALLRGVVLEPSASWTLSLRDGTVLLSGATKSTGGEALAVSPDGQTLVELRDEAGKVLSHAEFVPQTDRSYTALARMRKGKPHLEILTNNPPLSPRGRMGFSQGS